MLELNSAPRSKRLELKVLWFLWVFSVLNRRDHLLKEWDVSTCTCLRSLQGHKGPVFCVKAAPHRVVSCSADGFARIWDLVSLPEGKGQSKAIAFQGNVIKPTRVEENSL